LSLTPQRVAADAPRGMAAQFDLSANDATTGAALTAFERPLTLTVDLNGVVDRSGLKPGEHLALFHESGSPDAPWAELADALEIRPGVLQVKISHFSGLGGGSSDSAPASWQLKYNPPVVSTFSGAAMFSYPIEVGTGRNGLQPAVTLAYNSRGVDGTLALWDQDTEGVPYGWSLDLASISRNRVETYFCGTCTNYPTVLLIRPEFSLSLNGTNYDLIPATANPFGQYYVKDNPGLYVERRNDLGWNGSPENESHEYWIVKTGEGTTYRFGYTTDSEQTEQMAPAHYLSCTDGGYCGYVAGTDASRPATGKAAVRWRVDTITDVYGNTITVTYHTYTTADTFAGSGELTAEHTRPAEIRYNFVSGTATSRVVFTNTGGALNWINRIAVYHGGLSSKVREYQLGWDAEKWRLLAITQTNAAGTQWLPPTTFTYTDLPHVNNDYLVPYLTRIDNGYAGRTEIDYLSDNRRESSQGVTYLGYSYRVAETRTYDGINSAPARVQYQYQTACYNQQATFSPLVTFCRGKNAPKWAPLFGHAVVTQTALAYDGSVLTRKVYAYNIDDDPTMTQDPPKRGREITATTDAGAGQPILTQTTQEYDTQTVNGVPFTFLKQQTDYTYAGGLTAARAVSYTYDAYGNITETYELGDAATAADDRKTASVFNPTTSVTAIPTVTYRSIWTAAASSNGAEVYRAYDGSYSTLWQSNCYAGPNHREWIAVWFAGGAQSVDVIQFKQADGFETGYEIYYESGGTWVRAYPQIHDGTGVDTTLWLTVPVTTTGFKIDAPVLGGWPGEYCFKLAEMRFGRTPGPNTGQWIVSKPGYTNVYTRVSATAPFTLAQATWYSYDNRPQFNLPPLTGTLTAVRNWTGTYPAQFIDTVYTYDAYGNRRTVTTFDDLGTGTAYASTNPRTITTQYDPMYNLYSIKVTNASGFSTTVDYDFTLGVPLTTTDLNGAVTTYQYDAFGRLLKVIGPGDSAADPGVQYSYSDVSGASPFWVGPLRVNESRKPGSGGPGVRHFYDGLGREIQTHTGVSVTVSGSAAPVDIVVSVRYDARGLVISQTAPYTVPAYVYNSQVNPYTTTNAASAPKTLMAYDGLGRVITTTAPDGAQTINRYRLAADGSATLTVQDVVDANRHRKQYFSDVNGRLVKVAELTGNCTNWSGFPGFPCSGAYTTPWGAYAETRYTYDPLGNLRIVTDALTNTTVITYDALGRKTGMLDPDMGAWRYQYDNAGNLKVQDDAKQQRTCFYYDNLNRLIGKTFTTTAYACPVSATYAVTYTYDTGVDQRGYRTRLDDASGWTTWAYDLRGRVISETRSISGAGAFTTQYGYDGLDRVITTTYPTGEVVTQTYNSLGAVENVRSTSATGPFNQWYVSNLDYHANGSLALMQLGNGVDTTYTYFPLNFRLQRLQIGNAQAFNYGYDAVGNVLTLTTQITQPTTSTEVMAFKYDVLDRLTNAVAVTNGYTGTYGYDPIGNLITRTESGPTVLYTYGVTQPHAVRSLSNGNLYRYDANGNMTQRVEITATTSTYTQTWDAENRLTVVTGTVTATGCRSGCPAALSISRFTYDGDGNRVMQVQISGTQVITTAYAGAIEVQITATQRITKTYYSAGTQLIALRMYTSPTNSVLYFLHSDHLGSVSLTTDASGNPLARQLYDAWGSIRSGGSMPTDIGYTGQRGNLEVGLLFYRARFYAPSLGRFLSADTVVPSPSNPQQFNRYAYGLNNPVKYTDSSGHDVDCSPSDSACRARVEIEKRARAWGRRPRFTVPPADPAAYRNEAEQGFGNTRFAFQNQGLYALLSRLHNGIDIGMPQGTNLVAMDYGEVIGIDVWGAGPHSIVIRHGDYAVHYGHLRDAPTLQVGDIVSPGDVVGLSGRGDNFNHLHLEVRGVTPDDADNIANPPDHMYNRLWCTNP
jgi:RHS repeat-associated protein